MKKVKILINSKKRNSRIILKKAKLLVRKCGFILSQRPDFVIAIGGDGTMLTAANTYGKKGTPILGVNAGGLGFLTDVTYEQLPDILGNIKSNKYVFENRMVVQANVERRNLYGLNDLTIITRIPGRAVEFLATINKEYICRFIADGIIIATPTGSTAYSLATGGPILLPNTESLIVTPIAPHTLSVRPIVLPSNSIIEIKVGKKGAASLVADGQRSCSVRQQQIIKFKKADYYIRLVKPINPTFFNTLREKMKWGGREDA